MSIELSRGHEIINKINTEISRVVIGKDEMKKLLMVALLSQGHVLIEGLPGTAKTTTARTFAQAIGGKFKRIQGTPDMLPADVLGFHMYQTDGTSSLIPGPIFANVILADELNRTTPRTQAALLEAMQEHQVTIEQETHQLERPFIVIASQVPYGGPGTAPLSDVQIDRFLFRIWSTFPSKEEEGHVLSNIDQISELQVSPVATLNDIIELQQDIKQIHVSDGIRNYIIEILSNLRHHQDLVIGPSSRGGIALFKGARALAFVEGRDFVIPDDVKKLLVPAICHRLVVNPEAEMEQVTPEAVLDQVVSAVPVPKGEAVSSTGKTGAEEKSAGSGADSNVTQNPAPISEVAENKGLEPMIAVPDEATATDDNPPHSMATEINAPAVEVAERPAGLSRPSGHTFSTWQLVIISLAVVVAIVMICMGLLSIR